MTEHFVEERGIYYRMNAFVPGRQTLVLVHGVTGGSSAWRPYEARFEPFYNLVTYDLRGHGKSRKYPRCSDYAIPHFVEDLNALLPHLPLPTRLLITHPLPAPVALEFLRQHQHCVEGVVLVSADFDVGRRVSAKVLRTALASVALLELLPFHPAAGRHIDYTRYPNSGDWNIPRMIADVRNTTWRVYLYCAKACYTVHADAMLPAIRVPVVLMHGRKDTIFSVENSIYMATRIPTAELVVLDDADHILVLNRPREVGDAIERLLKRLPERARSGSVLTTPADGDAQRPLQPTPPQRIGTR
jgi:pimeloyl-ACP methyl ester carboxylesterase